MTPFQVYRLCLAMRLHFTTDKYDIIKFKGKVKTTEESFARQHGDIKMGTLKLARKYPLPEVVNFLVANFVAGAKWGRLFEPEAVTRYKEWQTRIESLSYRYKSELEEVIAGSSPASLFDCKNGHPPILKAYLNGSASIETLVILNKVLPFTDKVHTYLHTDIIWPDVHRLIVKYSPFVRIDKHKYSAITKQVIQNNKL